MALLCKCLRHHIRSPKRVDMTTDFGFVHIFFSWAKWRPVVLLFFLSWMQFCDLWKVQLPSGTTFFPMETVTSLLGTQLVQFLPDQNGVVWNICYTMIGMTNKLNWWWISVANKWIHEYGQEFRRPCSLRRDAKIFW